MGSLSLAVMPRYGNYRRYNSRRVAYGAARRKQAERTGDYTQEWAYFLFVWIVIMLIVVGICVYLWSARPVIPAWGYPAISIAAVACIGVVVYLAARTASSARAAAESREAIPGTWEHAEVLARDWLLSLGEHDARLGPGRQDGGVDVESSHYVVQVKHWQANVGGPAVRQIFGVATARGKVAIVVALSGYTRDAEAFATQAGVALFSYASGQIRASNADAVQVLRAHQ
jgi:hypothetical protein